MERARKMRGSESGEGKGNLYLAFELGNAKWKLAFSDGERVRYVSVVARGLKQLREEIEKARKRFRLAEGVRVVSCYEAGRDGFWLHRYLVSEGVENRVVDSSSIEVNRRKRRAKTDRMDAGKLVEMLRRYEGGEKRVWSVVRVPRVGEIASVVGPGEKKVLRRLHLAQSRGVPLSLRLSRKTASNLGFYEFGC